MLKNEGVYNMNNEYLKELFDSLEEARVSIGREYFYENVIDEIVDYFTRCKKSGNQLFFVGNGGSSAIASHMTADYMKNGGMNTYSLYDNAVTTCMGNDYGYEYVFSKPLDFLLKESDLLVAISSSGKSKNIINAIKTAQRKKAFVITLTGFDENNIIKQMGDVNIYVPNHKYGIVESIHNLILQQIVDTIMERDGIRI